MSSVSTRGLISQFHPRILKLRERGLLAPDQSLEAWTPKSLFSIPTLQFQPCPEGLIPHLRPGHSPWTPAGLHNTGRHQKHKICVHVTLSPNLEFAQKQIWPERRERISIPFRLFDFLIALFMLFGYSHWGSTRIQVGLERTRKEGMEAKGTRGIQIPTGRERRLSFPGAAKENGSLPGRTGFC